MLRMRCRALRFFDVVYGVFGLRRRPVLGRERIIVHLVLAWILLGSKLVSLVHELRCGVLRIGCVLEYVLELHGRQIFATRGVRVCKL